MWGAENIYKSLVRHCMTMKLTTPTGQALLSFFAGLGSSTESRTRLSRQAPNTSLISLITFNLTWKFSVNASSQVYCVLYQSCALWPFSCETLLTNSHSTDKITYPAMSAILEEYLAHQEPEKRILQTLTTARDAATRPDAEEFLSSERIYCDFCPAILSVPNIQIFKALGGFSESHQLPAGGKILRAEFQHLVMYPWLLDDLYSTCDSLERLVFHLIDGSSIAPLDDFGGNRFVVDFNNALFEWRNTLKRLDFQVVMMDKYFPGGYFGPFNRLHCLIDTSLEHLTIEFRSLYGDPSELETMNLEELLPSTLKSVCLFERWERRGPTDKDWAANLIYKVYLTEGQVTQ